MVFQKQLSIVLFGTCLFYIIRLLECRKIEGYAFPVFSTKECPRNQAEWNNRSSAINCTESNGYMCLPNENFTDLLEFCYIYPRILVQKDLCLYLTKRFSRVNSYNCRKFTHGCPDLNYFSDETYIHPSCTEIENGCFSADRHCQRKPIQGDKTPVQGDKTNNGTTIATILGVSIATSVLCILIVCFIRKRYARRRRLRSLRVNCMEEVPILLLHDQMENFKESRIEKAIFDQWTQDDSCFVSTKACEEVENIIKSRNLVIVAGHSGSGKSAIIQHFALKYRKQGWTVKRVTKVKDILVDYSSSRLQKTLCVFNDPLGKESFDEVLNNSWQTYEKKLKLYLKTAKLVMSCRNHIISDSRLTRFLVHESHVVNIDDNKYKLSNYEKRQILTKYTSGMNLSVKDCDEIVTVEKYFPLLCKLYTGKEEYRDKGIEFFTEPVTVLKEEIEGFRNKDKGKYCALALLVNFNDDLCVSDLFNKDTEYKFKHTLELCGLPENTTPSAIRDNLNSIKDCFVKSIGNTYHFYHDFVMEVTTHVFGTGYPAETIKFADIGFLRRRVKLGNVNEHDDPFTIHLSDKYTEELGERLSVELFGERVLDVVLNPCLRNEKIIKVLKEKITDHPQLMLETKKLTIDKQQLDWTSKSVLLSKLKFLELNNEVSPLLALIVFCHTRLSQYCIDALQQKQIASISCSLISAICCNGSIDLFNIVFKYHANESLIKTWGGLCPIHIASLFHNYELLNELIKEGSNVNQKTEGKGSWTPLLLAAGNDSQEYEHFYYVESGEKRRDKTVQLLLSNGADINLCTIYRASPLYIACENGHDSTIQLLLSNGADINLCTMNGASPLYIASDNGHESTVQLLLSNGADINLCTMNGASPLYIACKFGHDSTVQLLLSNGADINLCTMDEVSPLYIACENGHESTVQLLLSNGADINLCTMNGAGPLSL